MFLLVFRAGSNLACRWVLATRLKKFAAEKIPSVGNGRSNAENPNS